jgi:CDP-diglyceride synthetase
MLKRIATALVLIPVVILLVLRAPVPVVAAVAGAVALVTVQEFLKLTESYDVPPLRLPTYTFVGLFFLLLAADSGGETPQLSALKFVLALGFACAIAPFLFLTIAMRRTQMKGWCNCGSSGGERSGYSIFFSWFGPAIYSRISSAVPWDVT